MSSEGSFPTRSNQPLMFVISGPSGVGKDTVIQALRKTGLPLHFVITATTRPPRCDERDGVDYIFVSKEKFTEMIEKGELLEHALVYNDYKGIPKEQIRQAMKSGKDVILRVDVQGAHTIHSICPGAVLIFLTPANEQELIQRLKDRKSETEESLKTRIELARKEIERVPEFDYVVVNTQGKLEETVNQLIAIIIAEHNRVVPRKIDL